MNANDGCQKTCCCEEAAIELQDCTIRTMAMVLQNDINSEKKRYKRALANEKDPYPLSNYVEKLKRYFLVIVLLCSEKLWVSSEVIDVYWHSHLPNTQKYQREGQLIARNLNDSLPEKPWMTGVVDLEKLSKEYFSKTNRLIYFLAQQFCQLNTFPGRSAHRMMPLGPHYQYCSSF